MRYRTLPLALILAGPAFAEPKVLTDIPPVHSLVAAVMEGVGTPDLLLSGTGSAHGLSLRPSQARLAEEADLIFWIGPAMTPGLEKPFEVLGGNAHVVTLLTLPETHRIASSHDHDHEAEDHDHDHEHEAAHEEEHDHDHEAEDHGDDHDHDHDHDGGHDEHAHGEEHHDHGPIDPHAWLGPANAAAWLPVIAGELAEHDPANAETYRANATRTAESLRALDADIATRLAPFRNTPYLATHSAFSYFEQAYGLAPAETLSGVNATAPGPQAMEAMREAAEGGVTCLISEPEISAGTVETLIEGTSVKTVSVDPVGRNLPQGPGLYPALLEGLATAYETCLE